MKKLNKTLFSILLMLLLFSKDTLQTFAMETSFQLPVETVLEGDRPLRQETFLIQMQALTKDAPMPEQTENQKVTIEIQGQGKKAFPPITFKQPGVYKYEVRQQPGNQEYYTYDTCVYNVTVYCTADSAQGLETTVVALEQGKEEVKKDAVRFVNRYELPKVPTEQNTTVKTGDKALLSTLLWILLASGFMILFLVVKNQRDKRKIEE